MRSLAVLLLFPVLLFGQKQRFIYEYLFIPNLQKKDSVVKELMYLDVEGKNSKFYSAEKFRSDSIAKDAVEKQIKAGLKNFSVNKTYSGNNSFTVNKDLLKALVTFEDKIGTDSFLVTDTRKLNWKILPERKKIGEWDCQLATAEFGGRQWNAWFCPAIPLQDGPYKFHGLPGMTVYVEDTELLHRFNLVAIQNLPPVADTKIEGKANESGYGLDSKPVPVSLEKYGKLFKSFRDDPSGPFRQMLLSNKNLNFTKNGQPVSSAELIRDCEEYYRKRFREFNNPIELDLMK